MRTSRACVRGAVVAVGILGLTGCAPGSSETCVSWAFFDTPADAAQDAALVVRGQVVDRASTVELWGAEATTWDVEVAEVLAGDGAVAGEVVRVISAPQTCRGDGDVYPGGDPLDVEGEVVVILDGDDAGLRTITPFEGVVPPSADGRLPDAWPADVHR
jgi:hypothetical protein